MIPLSIIPQALLAVPVGGPTMEALKQGSQSQDPDVALASNIMGGIILTCGIICLAFCLYTVTRKQDDKK